MFLGRYTAQDIAVFARETSSSKVFTLGPENFPSPVTTGEENWFVDFFAPVRLVSYDRDWIAFSAYLKPVNKLCSE